MEVIKIGGRVWHKFKGDEGQDVYVAQFIDNAEELLGKYADESSYDILIDSDADFYLPQGLTDTEELTESRVAFKFRKNVFTKEEQEGAFEGLFDAAKESNNRGLAAGPREESQGTRDWVTSFQYDILKYFMDGQPKSVDGTNQIDEIKRNNQVEKHEIRGGVWLRTKVEEEFGDYKNFFPKCLSALENMSVEDAVEYATKIRKSFISDTNYATAIWSGIAGFYGRYPRIPYGRATAYTDHNREMFEKCYPFARKLEKEFARMLPERHLAQKEFADRLDNRFLIGEDTTFTTITVNSTSADRNARMACHKDAGSLNAGFSNLTVITKEGKNWKGGYLVAPEVRVAINVRPGDLLLIDNMRVIHGNTPIEAPDSGVEDFLRMSLVFYFREDMDKLGSWEYEKLRRQFVDDRKVNQSHELWRPFWNGVSPGFMNDDSEEWYRYILEKGGEEMIKQNQPKLWEHFNTPKITLESFFE